MCVGLPLGARGILVAMTNEVIVVPQQPQQHQQQHRQQQQRRGQQQQPQRVHLAPGSPTPPPSEAGSDTMVDRRSMMQRIREEHAAENHQKNIGEKSKVSMLQLANLKWISNHLNDSDNPDDLALLIRQVVTGGQIVVESVDKQLSKQVLLAIANMLPVGCCKMAGFRDAYRPEYSTSFNLMGGPINMDVPLEVSDVMILRITSNSGILHAETEDNFIIRDSFITVRRRPDKEDKEDIYAGNPAIVKRYRDLLLDTAVKDMVLETTMRTTRESWMQKAKLAYQMKGNARGLDILKNIIGCAIEDRQVVLFWQAGLSMAYKDHVHQAFETPRNSLSR